MGRIRVKIGEMVFQNTGMSAGEGATLAQMVEIHLARLMAAGRVPVVRNTAHVRVNARLNSGKQGASHETAMAIAGGIHQGLNGKR